VRSWLDGRSSSEFDRSTEGVATIEARQGVTGHNVRYVLWFGVAAAIVAFAAVYLFYF
jgi:hypothetical protein